MEKSVKKIKKTTKKKQARTSTFRVAKVRSKKAFANYQQAIAYLFERTDYEKERHYRYNVTTFNLDRMGKLLSLLGNPHRKIPTVHIAGTKGKGSTSLSLLQPKITTIESYGMF